MESQLKKIKSFVSSQGEAPYEEWFKKIRDRTVQARIATRIDRMRFGNFGDFKRVGAGIFELRVDIGPGYRIYFGLVGADVVLLLGGGNKSSQQKDIKIAAANWKALKNGKN